MGKKAFMLRGLYAELHSTKFQEPSSQSPIQDYPHSKLKSITNEIKI